MKRLAYSIFGLSAAFSAAAGVLEWPEVTKEMKPWAYNWWMGSAVDEAGLRLQVEEMEKVGMGGMHVIPIYSVKNNPNDKELLSDEWLAAFSSAVRIAGEKGMGVDLTTGSGWCFGGPQLKDEQGSWMWEVNSPRHDDANTKILWRGKNWRKRMVTLSIRPTGQKVKRSGPGGHGPMMNPMSPSAMETFLEPFKAAFAKEGVAKPEHMYHDSYEYFSAGCAPELFDAFKRRRGYDLRDHFAEMAGVGDRETIARVKGDFRETVSDLIVEETFPKWQEWCNANGMATRNEAHGASANWLDFYALADIPETEMFSCDKSKAQWPSVTAEFMNSGDRNILISKFASSAAHVKHAGEERAPLVTSESCTWVSEHFCETLGAIKTFVDRLFLSGVNHMFYHGMCYSPADAAWPGWTFYATCEMNRFNPIWRDVDILNAYITRVQSIAQTASVDNDMLIYWPLHDFWHNEEGFEKQLTVHARDWFEGEPLGEISRRLYDEGYSFDYISEKQLFTLPPSAKSGYKAIVVPRAVHMKVKTLAMLFELAKKDGYKVYFVGGLPTTVPGLKDVKEGEETLKILSAARPDGIFEGEIENLDLAAVCRKEPFNKAEGLMYTRHKKDGVTYYFIANQYKDEGVKARFKPAANGNAAIMDPMTGEIRAADVNEDGVLVDLPIGHSTILAVGERISGSGEREVRGFKSLALFGPWKRTPIAGGPEMPQVTTGVHAPETWGDKNSKWPECAFSGTMRYETEFDWAGASEGEAILKFGKVMESAKVYLNGEYVAGVFMAPWEVRFPARLLKAGKNTLAIDVTSTGANRLKWLDAKKPYEWQIFTDINMVDINYKKPFDASRWPQHEAGLKGPVVLNTIIK